MAAGPRFACSRSRLPGFSRPARPLVALTWRWRAPGAPQIHAGDSPTVAPRPSRRPALPFPCLHAFWLCSAMRLSPTVASAVCHRGSRAAGAVPSPLPASFPAPLPPAPTPPCSAPTMTTKEQRYAKMELRGSSYNRHWKTDLKMATCADPGCERRRRGCRTPPQDAALRRPQPRSLLPPACLSRAVPLCAGLLAHPCSLLRVRLLLLLRVLPPAQEGPAGRHVSVRCGARTAAAARGQGAGTTVRQHWRQGAAAQWRRAGVSAAGLRAGGGQPACQHHRGCPPSCLQLPVLQRRLALLRPLRRAVLS